MILSNQVKCLKCGDMPFSASRHDFRTCRCGNVSVDGGMDYTRRVFNDPSTFQELSIMMEDATVNKVINAIQNAKDTGRNNLGILCAVMRTLRDEGYINV